LPSRRFAATIVEIVNETTLAAARRLVDADERPGAFKGVYRQVRFSIMDPWPDRRTIGPFRKRFEGAW